MSTNWQEIVVTVVAVCAFVVLVRPFAPYPLGPRRTRGPNCAACAAGAGVRAKERSAAGGR